MAQVPDAYDFWLLDLDGTLIDVEPSYPRRVFDEIGDRLGHGFTDDDVETIWRGLGESPNARLERLGIDPSRFWDVFHEVEDPVARAESTFLYEDAAVVGELDGPTGIVTHCQDYLTGPVLDHLGIRDWFDVVVCCDDDLGWKPDPGPVERAMADLGVAHNGHEGVLAGDGPHDIGAAWNAGLDGIHVERHSPERRGHCVRGDYRVTGFDNLFDSAGD
ncbi:HAD family hydrolase [Halobacteriales archaeon QS_1_68_17]|nr:MAG: HAD family hydrolase [Halobacteriales archaeon QS_1_68_17]